MKLFLTRGLRVNSRFRKHTFKRTVSKIIFSLLANISLGASTFQHNLNIQISEGLGTPTLCMHGYGESGEILLHFLKEHHAIEGPLITFNFPDFDIRKNPFIADKLHFGTIEELLPALYVMKKYIIEENNPVLNLYGFSAGGGALINCLAILNSCHYDGHLQTIGVGLNEKKMILDALQKGVILLDSPLKSIEEIIDFRKEMQELLVVANRYRENNLRPIDSIEKLSGLSLNIILFFQSPDEIISNRDDLLFAKKLQNANAQGQTHVLIADQGSHNSYHEILWKAYQDLFSFKPDQPIGE